MGRLSASAYGALAVVTLKVFASASGAVNGPDIRGLAAARLSDRTPSAGYCAFDLTGKYLYLSTLTDATGNGWTVQARFTVTATP